MTHSRAFLYYEKGRKFEDFVANMFLKSDFEILIRADVDGHKIPDLYVKHKKTKEKFWVEVKWRSRLKDDKYRICTAPRLYKYKLFRKSVSPERVFLVLGLGGVASNPHRIYCLPIEKIDYPEIFRSKLEKGSHNSEIFRYRRGELY